MHLASPGVDEVGVNREASARGPRGRLLLLVFISIGSIAGAARADDIATGTAALVAGRIEVGLSEETSRFTEVRIGDSPAILIPGDHIRRSELFRHVAGAANASMRCMDALSCVGNLNFDSSTAARTGEVDTRIAQADVGLQYARGPAVYGARFVREQWRVGGQAFRRVDGVALDAVMSLGESLSAYALLNASRYTHPGDNAVLDADYRAATANLRWATVDGWRSAYSLQATLSRERNHMDDPVFDNRGVLVRASWEAKPAAGWDTRLGLTAQGLRFGAFDPVLGVRRVDRYRGFDLLVARELMRSVQLRLELGYARYRSSAASFDNDWYSAGTSIQWSF